jgi:hypothetical protein
VEVEGFFMNSSTQNTKLTESPEPSTVESEDVEARANRLAGDLMMEEILEGFRRLAKQKAAQKKPDQAA